VLRNIPFTAWVPLSGWCSFRQSGNAPRGLSIGLGRFFRAAREYLRFTVKVLG